MDQHTQDVCFPIEEDTAPLSPKRLRTDCTITNKHSCKTHFKFPEPLSFRNNDGVTSLQNRPILQEDKTHRVESDHEYLKYTVTGFHCEEIGKEESTALGDNQTCAGSCVISPHSTDGDSQGLCQGLHDPLSETGTSSYSVHSRNEAGCVSAKSHSSDDRTTDTSSSHDFNQPGKSLKCSLTGASPSADEEAVTEQNGESRLPGTDHSSSVSDGTEESDYTCESLALNSAIYSMGFIKGSTEGENNHQIQNEDKHAFNQSICCEKEARRYPLPSDYREGCESSGSHAETEPFGNFKGVKKNEGNVARENADVCDREAKAQVNKEYFMHNDSSAAAETVVEYVDGSVVTCYTVFDRPVLTDGAEINMGLKLEDLREQPLGHAVGTVTAETLCELGVDHNTTQKLSVSTHLSQKPADVNHNKIASVTNHSVFSDINGVALETMSPLHPPQPEYTTSPLHPPQPEDTLLSTHHNQNIPRLLSTHHNQKIPRLLSTHHNQNIPRLLSTHHNQNIPRLLSTHHNQNIPRLLSTHHNQKIPRLLSTHHNQNIPRLLSTHHNQRIPRLLSTHHNQRIPRLLSTHHNQNIPRLLSTHHNQNIPRLLSTHHNQNIPRLLSTHHNQKIPRLLSIHHNQRIPRLLSTHHNQKIPRLLSTHHNQNIPHLLSIHHNQRIPRLLSTHHNQNIPHLLSTHHNQNIPRLLSIHHNQRIPRLPSTHHNQNIPCLLFIHHNQNIPRLLSTHHNQNIPRLLSTHHNQNILCLLSTHHNQKISS
ncbi:uncharacterized protein LOC118386630 [Oncorhynchus keta]|uniref:uncharacterized protein LOC118386630 n=1 Tax=Oncorhynchus keta TaxID=8018 RepID=UPI00227A42BD|nr:uncharacterized protein LOC118386630 [Oncorhynchus keta]